MSRTPVGLVVVPGAGIGLATASRRWSVAGPDLAAAVDRVAAELAPRWVWWSAGAGAGPLVAAGVRPAACWDLAAVHRLLHGGRTADPATVWAAARGLPLDRLPRTGQLDLLDAGGDAEGGDPEEPVRPDGYLRPEWAGRSWAAGDPADRERLLARAARWAALALEVRAAQERALRGLPDPRPRPYPPSLAALTAHAESAAELLCVELAADGLPLDRAAAERVISGYIGARPADPAERAQVRAGRDRQVLRHVGDGVEADLRNPAQVRALLARIGIDVPDTRSWRLEALRGAHPAVDALLRWRRAERVATTYGYDWLDRHVGADGRLRGAWSGSDGAAGRMTAQSGLHNLPADLRVAVAAEPGHVLVRADLGQVEPRVLAAVSGDPALARATAEADLYRPVAEELGCDRATAKVAVLAAMYGQTSGAAGAALRRMEAAYPVALRFLRDADEAGRAGRDVRTYGGRLVRIGRLAEVPAPARGRFARNAVVQGAAAELFKAWAATVRAGLPAYDGRIVLCLHDELLLHVPVAHGAAAAALVERALQETTGRWAAGSSVRFVADIAVVARWSDAKAEPAGRPRH